MTMTVETRTLGSLTDADVGSRIEILNVGRPAGVLRLFEEVEVTVTVTGLEATGDGTFTNTAAVEIAFDTVEGDAICLVEYASSAFVRPERQITAESLIAGVERELRSRFHSPYGDDLRLTGGEVDADGRLHYRLTE